MSTTTQNTNVQPLTNQTHLVKAQEAVTGLQTYVTTPVANTMNYPKLAGTVLASYVVLEVLNHVVLGAYVVPYLVGALSLGATAASVLLYGTLAVSALGISWLAYKFFFKNKEVTVNPNVQYVQVDNTSKG